MSNRESGCYGSFPEFQCPENCPGPQSKFLSDTTDGEGYLVQLCLNPQRIDDSPDGINFSGNGPDVLVFHQTEFPDDASILEATEIL